MPRLADIVSDDRVAAIASTLMSNPLEEMFGRLSAPLFLPDTGESDAFDLLAGAWSQPDSFIHALGQTKLRALGYGATEVGTVDISICKVCPGKVGIPEIDISQVGSLEHGKPQIAA